MGMILILMGVMVTWIGIEVKFRLRVNRLLDQNKLDYQLELEQLVAKSKYAKRQLEKKLKDSQLTVQQLEQELIQVKTLNRHLSELVDEQREVIEQRYSDLTVNTFEKSRMYSH